MANDYFNHVNNRLTGLTRALASSINAIADEIAQAFDKIPSENEFKANTFNLATNIGTADAWVANLASTPSLVDGYEIRISSPDANSGATCTLNLNNLGAKPVLNSDNSILTAGAVKADTINTFYWNVSLDSWVMQSNNSAWGKPDAVIGGSDTELCPGYTYEFVNTTTWRIQNLDASALFSAGRRLRFTDGGNVYFGQVVSSDHDVTSPDDTTIVMTMEGGDVLTNTITEVCLVTSAVSWAQIAEDPFNGNPIFDIATGQIGATQWWVIVGAGGRLATSTDKGVSWTIRSLSTSENIVSVAYAPSIQTFLAMGAGGVIRRSTDGSTWTSPGNYTLNGGRGGGQVRWSEQQDSWVISVTSYDVSGRQNRFDANDGASITWSAGIGATFTFQQPFDVALNSEGPGYLWMVDVNRDLDYYTSVSDATPSASITDVLSAGEARGVEYVSDGLEDRLYVGGSNGEIWSARWNGQVSPNTSIGNDTTTFSAAINDFAFSLLHTRYVCVGDDSQVGYLDRADTALDDGSWTQVPTGFNPTADVTCVDFNEDDGVFIAAADNGQICRSSNGTM